MASSAQPHVGKILVSVGDAAENQDAVELANRLAELTEAEVVEARDRDTGARSLGSLAETVGADMVVVGSSARGPSGKVLLGSVAKRALGDCARPVGIAPRGLARRPRWSWGAIGVAFDGAPEAYAAVARATGLAHASQATLRVITVIQPDLQPTEVRDLERRAEAVVDSAPRDLQVERRVVFGAVVERLLAETERLDLIVLGSRGYGLLHRILVGYVSRGLLRRSSCPVLVVPGPTAPGEISAGTALHHREPAVPAKG
jgi:nucleotide-binding universal stress UspA family protein